MKAISEPQSQPPEKIDHGYKCGVCGQEFRFKWQLKQHKRDEHSV